MFIIGIDFKEILLFDYLVFSINFKIHSKYYTYIMGLKLNFQVMNILINNLYFKVCKKDKNKR